MDDVLEDGYSSAQSVEEPVVPASAPDQEAGIAEVPPVYLGGARLINWGNTASSGMTVEIMLKDVGPREVNPFKGLKYGKSNGQRFKTWVGPYNDLAELSQIEELESVYFGESQLGYYGDTCTKGVTVKIMLDSGPDGVNGKHPFEGMPTGPMEGMDLYVRFVAIDDQEQPISKKHAPKTAPLHQQSEVRQAHTFSRDEEFVNFLHARLDRLIGSARPQVELAEGPREWALEVVRLYLGVEQLRLMNSEDVDGIEPRKKWKLLASEYLQSSEYHTRLYHLRR
ncbi:hypothetical protein HFN89_04895 [Rhizobium laguerreae]|nr:hypothetical protein [Rhizobium laguerreae]